MADVDVAVVGAGISGLATAHRLAATGCEVRVFEADGAVGGRMRTDRRDGYIIDQGVETIARFGYQSTWELLREVGMTRADVVKVGSVVGVWRHGTAVPWVGHPLSGLTGAGLSFPARTRLNLAIAGLLRGRFDVDQPEDSPLGVETIADFARRRCGEEALDFMLQPAVGTGFGWDPERSTIAPLVAAMFATRGIFGWMTYREGMDTLARRLAAPLDVHTSRPVATVKRDGRATRLSFVDGDSVTARSVVLTVPAPLVATLHPDLPDDERPYLDACTYSTMIRVSCLLDRPLRPPRRRGRPRIYALLVPHREDPVLCGGTVEHDKAANRCPPGAGLVSLLLAPGVARDMIDSTDEEITRTALAAGEAYLPGLRDACQTTLVHRFRHAQPEATAAALAARRGFLNRPARAVEYAGDWLNLRPQSEGAVRSARIAVPRVLAHREAERMSP